MKSQQKKTPAKKPRQNKVLTDDQIRVIEADDQFPSTSVDTTINLDNYGATMSIGSLTYDDIIRLDSTPLATITLPSTSYMGGASGGSTTSSITTTYNPNWNTGGSSGYTFTGINVSPPTVNIGADGIDIKEGGDIKVDGVSLKEFMTKVEQRLAILVPDPNKLEKFEALKKAYEHYKTMESLCFDEPKDEEPK